MPDRFIRSKQVGLTVAYCVKLLCFILLDSFLACVFCVMWLIQVRYWSKTIITVICLLAWWQKLILPWWALLHYTMKFKPVVEWFTSKE